MKPLKLIFAAASLAFGMQAFAAAPAGYYSACEGKSGKALLEALHRTISDHTNVGYNGLYELYLTSDIRPEDNTIWDMYSTKHWSPSSKCGNYSGIGSCYNREHSFPKSWFGGKVNPMYADAYHLYPTDGQVNSYRGNLPYGECANGTTWSSGSIKALGRRGKSTFPGYSGDVFEPDDEYKGDFARSYFYMAACYNDRISSWSSPMLAGNSFPVFSSWACSLLVKWHRNDAVSKKETDRNDAVSAAQHNRNPFIDHPELAEHIWGDKQNEPWHSDAVATPEFTSPAPGASLDLGITAKGHPVEASLSVAGVALNSRCELTVAPAGEFTVTPASIDASTVCNGTSVRISYSAAKAGKAEATLTIKSGTATRSVALKAESVDGLPLNDPSEITENSFTLTWRDIFASDPSATCRVDVRRDGVSIAGYPAEVRSSAGRHTVKGLEPATAYTASIASGALTSRTVSVTTGTPLPSVTLMFDAELNFTALPGEPSDAAEILVESENIDGAIEIEVEKPFEVSTDRSDWLSAITLVPGEDRFYMRLGAADPGSYTTSISVTAGDYENDDASVEGTVTSGEFFETFEAESDMESYGGGEYAGTATLWRVESGNIWEADRTFNGTNSMRFNTSGVLATMTPKQGGVGTVTLDLRKWDNRNDPAATVELEYSTDRGTTWESAGSATTSESRFTTHTFTVNRTGEVMLRVRQTEGKRFNLDNLRATDWAGPNEAAQLEYHRWDAFCRDGRLVIATRDDLGDLRIEVYDPEGRLHRALTPAPGSETLLDLPPGLYIVATDTFSRRVVVR